MPYRIEGGERTQIRYHVQMQPTVIDDTDHVAGYLPAPKDANDTQVVEAESRQEESTPAPEQMDLASSLFGMNVQTAPESEPEADLTQNVMFTYMSGKVKHELRAGATIVKVGRAYYTQLGRKITAIYTDSTCKRTVPERHYARLFNVSEDPTLFA